MANKATKGPALELVTEEPKSPLQLPDGIQAAIAPLITPLLVSNQ